MAEQAIRETFGLMPPGTSHYLYVVFAPFALVFAYGAYLRLARSGLIDLVRGGSGGIDRSAGRASAPNPRPAV